MTQVLIVRSWIEGLSPAYQNLVVATLVLLIGLIVGAIAAWLVGRILTTFRVESTVEGTAFGFRSAGPAERGEVEPGQQQAAE